MKVTPLEIRQKTFEKVFRGYDKDEVSAYLQSLSQEWEKLLQEKKELTIKLEASENEIKKLREVETSLYKTLKTAEDTGASMIEQANKASELQLQESKIKAENLVTEAKTKAKTIVDSAENEAKDIIKQMMEEVKSLEQSYNMVMTLKENLIFELKNFTSDTLEKVEKFKAKKDKFNIEKHIKSAKEFAYAQEDNPVYSKMKERIDKANPPEIKQEEGKISVTKKASDEESSFFDMID